MAIIPLDAASMPQVPLVTAFVAAHPTLSAALASVTALVLSVYFGCFIWNEYRLPYTYRNVPGPPRTSFFLGNLTDIMHDQTTPAPMQWFRQYGTTIRYSYFFGTPRFTTTDARAAEYIVQHTDLFIRPPQMTRVLGWAFGHGLLTVEGEAHKRQRRVLSPAFGPKALRPLVGQFWDAAYALSHKLDSFFVEGNDVQTSLTPALSIDRVPGARKIDVLKYLGQATLDINGRAGFAYEL